jgi:TolB protein
LTNNQSYEIQPRLSPDGEWIAFATNRDGDGSLYRICLTPARFPSEEWTCLTEANVDSRYPAWSPDGQRLVFASKSDGSWDIFVMDRDGTNLEKLVDHPANDRMPGWSADGTIFFVSDRSGGGDIYKMDADGRNLGLVFDKPGYDASPMASPDGSILAYASSGANDSYHTRIYLYHLKSGDIELLTDWSGTSNNYPIWSKDGQILYFTSTLYWGTRDIWRMDLDDKDHADNLTEDWREDTFGGP